MKPSYLVASVLVCLMAWAVPLSSAQVTTGCIGDAPNIPGTSFNCVQGAWHSNGSVALSNCSWARFSGPTVINGNLTLDSGAVLIYQPHGLTTTPFITLTGCGYFQHAIVVINMTKELVKDMVYATELKQKNKWFYMLPLQAACSHMNVSTLAFESEIHWNLGVGINSTFITSKKTKGTYVSVPPGQSGIQLGFISGMPLNSQGWFPAVVALTCICLLLIVASEWIKFCTAKPTVEQKSTDLNALSLNGDDKVSLLDDVDD